MSLPAAPRAVCNVTLVQALALLAPIIAVSWNDPKAHAILLATAIAFAIGWESLFTLTRQAGLSLHGVTTALIVTILIPSELPLWQLAFVVSLGVVLGELVFGGRGFNFLSPSAVVLALLLISFPDVALLEPTRELALATLPGTVLLLASGLISWRVLLAVFLSVTATLLLRGHGIDFEDLAVATIFGATFLIADPTASSTTPAGRWIYGGLAGALFAVFFPNFDAPSEAFVFAALLASIFAPLIDHVVVLFASHRRKVRCNA